MDVQDPTSNIWKHRGIQGKKEGIEYEETFSPVTNQVYVEKPLGVETHEKQTHVCKLKKALYELRRHP